MKTKINSSIKGMLQHKGFSLIELIVVIAVISVLMMLLLSWSGGLYDRKKNFECVSNIRHTGMALLTYVQDNNNVLYSFHGGADVTDHWVRRLFMGGYLIPNHRANAGENDILIHQISNVGNLLRCPVGNIGDDFLNYRDHPRKWIWQTYGLAMYDPNFEIEFISVNGKNSNLYSANLNRIADPANYILLADSAISSPAYNQTFRISRYQGSGGVALRHDLKANTFFLDGHVAAINYKHAKDLGVPEFNIFEIK